MQQCCQFNCYQLITQLNDSLPLYAVNEVKAKKFSSASLASIPPSLQSQWNCKFTNRIIFSTSKLTVQFFHIHQG